jgi:hypothetical protein
MALNQRRSRDRQVQRVILDEAAIYDRMIHDEIDDWAKPMIPRSEWLISLSASYRFGGEYL